MFGNILAIVGVLVALVYLVLVTLGLVLKFKESRALRKIKERPIALEKISLLIEAEKEKTRQMLLGFSFSEIVHFGSSFVLAVAVLASNWLALQTMKVNKNAYLEFELKTRPYVIVDNLEGNTDLTSMKSEFRLFLKNTGNMPAKIISQLMDCPTGSTLPSSAMLKSDIIGTNQSIVYPFSIQGVKEVTCTLDVKYRSALEVTPSKDYETQQKILYQFGSQASMGGGFMK